MTSVEAWDAASEDAASQATAAILSGDSVGTLIVSVLIVGVLAGFSEEIFFRGALQRILMATRLPAWSVIWIVAVIFQRLPFSVFRLYTPYAFRGHISVTCFIGRDVFGYLFACISSTTQSM